MVVHNLTKAVDHCPFLEVDFVLAKVCLGLISVRCSELRGVRVSEVRNVLVLWQKELGAGDLSAVERLSAFQRVRY